MIYVIYKRGEDLMPKLIKIQNPKFIDDVGKIIDLV